MWVPSGQHSHIVARKAVRTRVPDLVLGTSTRLLNYYASPGFTLSAIK